jgi:transcriptional regulator with PAS, ATPase and Fis domain
VRINCAALPAGLVESELFGNEAGAFTGAKARSGLIAAAAGGTLLLDEIAEMEPGLQAKLLRVLQEKVYQPVGSTRPRPADIRVVASTNRPVAATIANGSLREDLYFRLAVFEVLLPPLRERPDDILPLARLLLAAGQGDRPRRLSPEVEALLCGHGWPGNVRELANIMERARILARGGQVRPEHLPPGLLPALAPPPRLPARSGSTVHEMERELIMRTLAETGGNRTRAAERLGLSRRALLYKLKRYGAGE